MTGRKKRITVLAAIMGTLVTVQGIAAYQSAFDTAEKSYVWEAIQLKSGKNFLLRRRLRQIKIQISRKKYG